MTDRIITVNDDTNHVRITQPEHDDTTINISLDTDDTFTLSLDYYHDRPILYVYGHTSTEPQYMIALPTRDTATPTLLDTGTPISTQLNK